MGLSREPGHRLKARQAVNTEKPPWSSPVELKVYRDGKSRYLYDKRLIYFLGIRVEPRGKQISRP